MGDVLCCAVSVQVVNDELGAPWYEIYADLTPEPIAAASLGQVYRGRLKTGEEVAVKVQRPGVLVGWWAVLDGVGFVMSACVCDRALSPVHMCVCTFTGFSQFASGHASTE